jgi:hypothetical protein
MRVFHQGARSIEASATPADELAAIECNVILVDLFSSKDLFVICFYFEDLCVMVA